MSAIRYREFILQLIRQSDGHLTAEQVFLKAKETYPNIVMATVYNNLAALTRDGLIRRIKIYGRADCYDKTRTAHDHLICDCCGRLTDIGLGNFSEELERRLSVHVQSYELNVHYICKECAKKSDCTFL